MATCVTLEGTWGGHGVGMGWTWGRWCLCPRHEPVIPSLCHGAELGSPAQHRGGRAAPGCLTCSDRTLSLFSLPPPRPRDCSLLKKSCSCRWLCPVSLWEVWGGEDVCARLLLCLNSLRRTVWAGWNVFTQCETKTELKKG